MEPPDRSGAGRGRGRRIDAVYRPRHTGCVATNQQRIVADWVKRMQAIKVGDTVACSKAFLQSTGQYTGDDGEEAERDIFILIF